MNAQKSKPKGAGKWFLLSLFTFARSRCCRKVLSRHCRQYCCYSSGGDTIASHKKILFARCRILRDVCCVRWGHNNLLQHRGMGLPEDSLLVRLLGGTRAFWFYIWKDVAPVNLTMVYPLWPRVAEPLGDLRAGDPARSY